MSFSNVTPEFLTFWLASSRLGHHLIGSSTFIWLIGQINDKEQEVLQVKEPSRLFFYLLLITWLSCCLATEADMPSRKNYVWCQGRQYCFPLKCETWWSKRMISQLSNYPQLCQTSVRHFVLRKLSDHLLWVRSPEKIFLQVLIFNNELQGRDASCELTLQDVSLDFLLLTVPRERERGGKLWKVYPAIRVIFH